MNLDELKEIYFKDTRCSQIANRLSFSKPNHLLLKGLSGSALEMIIASVSKNEMQSQSNHLIVMRDAEEAAYLQNTLENITQALDIFYFPSSFKNKKNYQLLNSSHVMLRTEALTRISSGGNKKIMVSYPEAIMEKVVLPEKLQNNIIHIKQADEIDVVGSIRFCIRTRAIRHAWRDYGYLFFRK
jgi:transcription-repair coupling factor (superfamily II helicase)